MLLVCREEHVSQFPQNSIYPNSRDSRYLLSYLVCSKTMDSFLPSFDLILMS